MSLEIRRLSNALGAEITGLDLTGPLDEATVAGIRSAWLDHEVLLFRGQDLTPEQHIAFSRCFGDLDKHAARPFYTHPDHRELYVITNRMTDGKPSDTRNTGRQWHSDLSFTVRPAMGSLLHCHEIPEIGGDTVFANMALAWDRLSETMKGVLDGLRAVHDTANIKSYRTRDQAQFAEIRRINPPVAQPVVRVHSETGRKALYVSEALTTGIVGMTEEESAPILEFLFAHCTQPEFCYRHRWRVHDLLMWDNRATIHVALKDYEHSSPRHMLRTSLLGEPCGEPHAG